MKGRTEVGTYVRTDVDDVMAIKPNFLTSMGYHIFLTMVLRARGAPLSNLPSSSVFSKEAQDCCLGIKIPSQKHYE